MSNNFISLAQAIDYTTRYRTNLPNMLTASFTGALSYSETFDAAAIQAVLNQPGCVGFRAYYGMKPDNKVCTIFVGVNENNEDMIGTLSVVGGISQDDDGLIVDDGATCPPFCPPLSDLNP